MQFHESLTFQVTNKKKTKAFNSMRNEAKRRRIKNDGKNMILQRKVVIQS